MKYNIFSGLLIILSTVFFGCNVKNNMMGDSDKAEELKKEEMKFDLSENCQLCPSCNSDYRYFYICSHGAILMMCNECYTSYDVSYEMGLRNKKDKHQIDMYECFNNRSRLATKDDLKEAGLLDCVNNLGLLDEDETDM
jgi:hypothetical protein